MPKYEFWENGNILYFSLLEEYSRFANVVICLSHSYANYIFIATVDEFFTTSPAPQLL